MNRLTTIILLTTLLISTTLSAININVGGTISANTGWNADTVKITSDVIISNGITLTVAPGTYVQAQGQYKIDVKGTLLAIGSSTNKITFSALSANVGWKGIRFDNTLSTNDSSKLVYCTITRGRAVATTTWQDRAGGAIFMYNFSKLELRNCILSNNYAATYGGAMALEYKASPKITNCLIVNNTSASTGGAMDIYNLSNPILINNTIAYNSSSQGGALWTYNFAGTIMNCIFYGNTASNSSQIYGTVSNISNCLVQGGYNQGLNIYDTIPGFVSAPLGAGSAYDGLAADFSIASNSYLIDKGSLSATNFQIENFDVYGNFRFDNNMVDIGASEYISSTEVCGTISSNITWSGKILMNCDVTVNSGATLTIQPGTKIIVTGPYFLDVNGTLLAQGTFDNMIEMTAWNKSEGWKGITFTSVATTNDSSKIEYCKLSYKNNIGTSSYYYGVIYANNSSKLLIRNNILVNNYSRYGAGISMISSSATITGNLIVNNQTYFYGAGLYLNNSSSIVANNTIANNKSTNYSVAYAVYKVGTASPTLRNNIIYGNQDNSGNHSSTDNAIAGIDMQYSCVEGGYTGTGNTSSAPLFKNPTPINGIGVNINNYNFSLQSSSPCIDAGSTSYSGLNLPTLDLFGKTRIYSSSIDMGAYEDKSSLAVCGTISADETWDANIININCDVTIPTGVTVTIPAGTKVLFNGFYRITVNGALQAIGAEGDSITFTASNTTTGWNGIQVDDPNEYANDSTLFDYCVFEYAKRAATSIYTSGGALSLRSCSEIRVTNSRFSNNTVSGSLGYGAAMSLVYLHGTDYANKKFNNNKFTSNTGTNGIIGLTYSNVTFKNNVAYDNSVSSGAVVRAIYSGGLLSNNLLANNLTYYGAVYFYALYSNYYVYLNNNIIANNQGVISGGGTYNDISPELYNNTIVNNYITSTSYAGGLNFMGNADAKMKNNIIYGNEIPGGISVQISIADVAADPKFYNNDIQNGRLAFVGTGAGINYTGVFEDNIDVTPDFVSPSADAGTSYNGIAADWTIAQGSALINAGYSNFNSLNISDFDFNGDPRVFNGRIDIGAIENQEPIIAPCTISEDTEWEADTIRVSCDMTIESTNTLTIKPGSVVLFTGFYEISVEGAIQAIGTPDQKIQFIVNDTTGFWDSTTTNGGWNGINFNSILVVNDSSKFSYCVFKYAKAAGSGYADRSGSAMYIYNSPKISITNSIFSNNWANYQGGALYLESSNIGFKNNIIANNSSGNYSGGLYFEDFSGDFVNNTIVNNKAKFYGGAYFRGCEANLYNNIFWGNHSYYYSNNYSSQVSFYTSSLSKMENNLVQYGVNLIGYGYQLSSYTDNLDIDPSFINPSGSYGFGYDGVSANWNVTSYSPVLNKGKYGVNGGIYDFAGNERLVADTLDIGAYEIQLSRQFIDVQPSDIEICQGLNGSFTTHATVNGSYQWQKNGLDIAGATTNILYKSSISLSDSGYYHCVISNAYGSISTDTVELRVLTSPVITTSPSSKSECLGASVSFSAGANGSEPITYQWYNTNGALGSGASNQTFTVGEDSIRNSANAYPSPFANYFWGNKEQYLILASELTAIGMSSGEISSLGFDVYAINSCPTLSNFELKIGTTSNNSLTGSWVSGLTSVYAVASYQVNAGWNNFGFTSPFNWDGSSNIVIEICSNNSSWISNGNASVNQTATLFNSVQYYRADVSTACTAGSASSTSTNRPNIKFSGSSTSSGLSTYNINSISANSASNYYLIATNSCGSAQSNGATLGIKYAPSLTPISASDDICEDNSYTYSTTTSQGTTPITYQWFKDGTAISSANALTYNITSGTTSDAGIYYCKATNVCGNDSTNQSVLAVNEKPQITNQSPSQTVCSGQAVTFSVTASGTAPITYQWYNGSNSISGATNNTYSINSVSSSDAGTYYCKVSNGCVSAPVSSTGIALSVNSAPSLTSQTGSVDVCSGSAAPFSVTATGTSPITYQWYNSSGSIGSATNNSYTISSASTSNTGNYYCIATNSCGNVTSNAIPLTVNSSPSINSQPQSLVKCENQSAIFNIQSNGTAPITYQWYKGGVQISGATSSSYLISPISNSDASTYYCIATNSCGNATSSSAALTVNSGVVISSQSSSQTICEGASPSFQVTVSGTTPITYQWYNDQGSVSGATSSSLSITSADTSDAGNYYCIATNGCTSTTSASILLTVNESPSIDNQPSSKTVCENLSAVFNVSASGTAPLSYQWYDNSGSIAGATSSSYIIPQVSSTDAGTYYVKVSNSCGNVNSNSALLTVKDNVVISSQSSSLTVCDGASPSLSITASGSSTINYQWYKNNTSITGATNNSLSLTSVDSSDAGTYYVIASNSCNFAQSNSILLTVNQSPSIDNQPLSQTVCENLSSVFNVSASGTAPLAYQWYGISGAISGATSSSYLIAQNSSATAGSYYVKVTNSCGFVNSNSAILTINSNVALTAQSSSKTVCEGASPSFSVTASGSPTITYQWYKNSIAISGSTNNSLSLTSVDTSDIGTYHVVASNLCNTVQSNQMLLTVNESPSIISQPTGATLCSGSSKLLTVSATGTSPIAYQWYKSGTPITGATSSSYQISSASSSDIGSYYVIVSNSCGNEISNSVSINVNNPVSISSQSSNLIKCTGASATYSVTATGTSPITYQWYFNGNSISGAISSSYIIAQVDTVDEGDYYCIVTNSCNSVQSATLTLTVNETPQITQQSSGTSLCSGSNINLSVSVEGTNPLSYQWYKTGVAINGSTNSNLALYQVGSQDAGTYKCTVSNSCGSVSSSDISIVVNDAPSISAQSSSTSVCENAAVQLSVTAAGTAPLNYQWYNSNGLISGATNTAYLISSADTSDADLYYCKVTNSCGMSTSSSIVLTVNQAPTITNQSSGATKCVGSAFSFSVTAQGTNPLNYQWYDGNGLISGAQNNLYIINSVDTVDAGTYYCVVSNGCGSVTSTNKVLNVNQSPSFISQSTSATKCEGSLMLFTVSADGSSPLTYQWYNDTGLVSGANANTYTISSVSTLNAGNYYCVVSNGCGTITSSTKTLTVNTSPSILSQSTSDTLCQGQTMVFNVNTAGTTPISYQWYKNAVAVTGAVNNLYMIASVDTLNVGTYYAIATNVCGNLQSTDIHLTVEKLAQIIYQSGDSSRCVGGSVQLSVQTTGTTPVTYQWYKGGLPMSSATSSLVSIPNLSLSDAAYYYCKVTNMCNSVTSANKVITIHSNPQINLGNDTTFCLGGQALLSAGFGYNCIWSNGSFNNQISVTQTGSYWVNATDQYGCSGQSDTININVVQPYANSEICMAGVDSATQKNVIVWEKTPNVGISSYNVYRESSVTGVWSLIENKHVDSLSVVFDMTSNPAAHADRYAITAIDSCQNESPRSIPHKTMHLAVSLASPSGYNLNWSGYQGFQVASYLIWKADSTMNWTLVDSVNGNIFMWHDTTSALKPFWYQVEVIRPGGACNPTKANTNYNTSRSNQASNGLSAPVSLAPDFIATPTQGIAPLVVVFYDQSMGNPTGWYWNFGDGNTSTLQNPAHQYDSVGVYDVTLTITSTDGVKSITKFGFIDVVPDGISIIDNPYSMNVFPNPYSGKTNIEFSLSDRGHVIMEVYTPLGQLIEILDDKEIMPGKYHYEFSAIEHGMSAGVYYLRVNIDGKSFTHKLIELK